MNRLAKESANQAAAVDNILFLMKLIADGHRQHADIASRAEEIAGKASLDTKAIGYEATKARGTVKQIAEITFNIRKIAQQTNFLALNTSLEVVNGIEQSKNFAAAALRVGKLAIRSKRAAGEITEQVNSHLKIVDSVDEKLKILLPDLHKTLDLVREINTANNMQESILQIDKSLHYIESGIQHNSTIVEAMVCTGADILSQLEKLKGTIADLLNETEDNEKTKA